MSQEQYIPLNEGDFHQDVSQPDHDEIEQRNHRLTLLLLPPNP